MHGWGQGSVTRTLPLLNLFANSSYVLKWTESSDSRLILFHTSLHYIDAADLRSRSKIEFLHIYSICIRVLCYNVF